MFIFFVQPSARQDYAYIRLNARIKTCNRVLRKNANKLLNSINTHRL